jgi:hypothetical protein
MFRRNNKRHHSQQRQLSRNNNNNTTNRPNNVVVGTEALARRNIEHNGKSFRYPVNGFEHPIEHSLLYAMLSNPEIYPDNALQKEIRDVDFDEYMIVKSSPSSTKEDDEITYSYAQLSAVLTLAAEKWPGDAKIWDDGTQEDSIPKQLCRTLLRTVIRHAEAHELDREAEVRELLEPLERLTNQKDLQMSGAMLLPMYIGMGASMLTANPIPLYLGWVAGSALSMQDAATLNNQCNNLRQLQSTTDRMADVEKAGLLDDSEAD